MWNPLDDMSVTSLSIGIVVMLIILCFVKPDTKYWEDRGVTAIPAKHIISYHLDTLTKPFHTTFLERCKKYGRVHGYYDSGKPALLVAEPKLIKDILVKDFHIFPSGTFLTSRDLLSNDMIFNMGGERWKRMHSLLAPAFSTGKVRKMFDVMSEAACTLSKNLSAMAKSGETQDMKKIYAAFVMDSIAISVFGIKVDSQNDPENVFTVKARKAFTQSSSWRFMLHLMFPRIANILGVDLYDPSSVAFFKKVTFQIIMERKEDPSKRRNDFLQALIEAAEISGESNAPQRDEEDEDKENDDTKVVGNKAGSNNSCKLHSHGTGLCVFEIVAISVMFFLVGFDTTSTALCEISYALAMHTDIQEKLIQEVDECIRQNKNLLNYEAVLQMKYMDMVIAETLRIYSPATAIERIAVSDYKLGSAGIPIKKGMSVVIPMHAIHHDPEFYPEPEKFDPMRFSAEGKSARDPLSYLPFGTGPRSCIGMGLALIQIKICLAFILSQFRLRRCPHTKITLEFTASLGTLQAEGVNLKIEERDDKPQN